MSIRRYARQLENAARESLTTRQRIERSTAHIPNRQERARVRFNLWAAEPDPQGEEL